MEVTITNENLKGYLEGGQPLVVDLWAPWCGPCRMLGPVISELAADYDGRIVVGKCNVDEEDDVAIEYGVRNIPTILFSTSSWVPLRKLHSTRSSAPCCKRNLLAPHRSL